MPLAINMLDSGTYATLASKSAELTTTWQQVCLSYLQTASITVYYVMPFGGALGVYVLDDAALTSSAGPPASPAPSPSPQPSPSPKPSPSPSPSPKPSPSPSGLPSVSNVSPSPVYEVYSSDFDDPTSLDGFWLNYEMPGSNGDGHSSGRSGFGLAVTVNTKPTYPNEVSLQVGRDDSRRRGAGCGQRWHACCEGRNGPVDQAIEDICLAGSPACAYAYIHCVPVPENHGQAGRTQQHTSTAQGSAAAAAATGRCPSVPPALALPAPPNPLAAASLFAPPPSLPFLLHAEPL